MSARLPVEGLQRKGVDAAGVADVGLRLAGDGLEVALVAVRLAHALGVFVQLAGVEGARRRCFPE